MKQLNILFSAILLLFVGCRSIKETKKFSECEFTLDSFKSARVAGVNLLGIANINDLNPLDGALLLKALSEKKLLLTTDLVLGIKNPNNQKAALSRLDWVAYIDNVKLAEGTINERVEVEPNGKATMPVRIEVDLVDVFSQKDSKKIIGDLLKTFSGKAKEKDNKFIFKSKPYFQVGKKNKLVKSPVYINVKQKF